MNEICMSLDTVNSSCATPRLLVHAACAEPQFVPRGLSNLADEHGHHASLGNQFGAGTMKSGENVTTGGIHSPQARKIDSNHRTRCRRHDLLPADNQLVHKVACQITLESHHQLAINSVCRDSEHEKAP